MTHRKGEEKNTQTIEHAQSGSRYLVIVGKRRVITRHLSKPHPHGCNCPWHGGRKTFVRGSYGPGGRMLNVYVSARHRRTYGE